MNSKPINSRVHFIRPVLLSISALLIVLIPLNIHVLARANTPEATPKATSVPTSSEPLLTTTSATPTATTKPALNAKESAFCTVIANKSGNLNNSISGELTRLENKYEFNKENQLAKEKILQDNLAAARGNLDAARAKQILKLEEKARTEVQLQALNNFETAVKTAVTARREAVDLARTNFQTGAKQLIAARQAEVKQTITNRQNALAAALKKAQDSCLAGVNPREIRAAYQAELKSIQTQYQAAHQVVTRFSTEFEALKTTRRAAYQEAEAVFKTTVNKAKEDLKAVLESK